MTLKRFLQVRNSVKSIYVMILIIPFDIRFLLLLSQYPFLPPPLFPGRFVYGGTGGRTLYLLSVTEDDGKSLYSCRVHHTNAGELRQKCID